MPDTMTIGVGRFYGVQSTVLTASTSVKHRLAMGSVLPDTVAL